MGGGARKRARKGGYQVADGRWDREYFRLSTYYDFSAMENRFYEKT